MSGFRDYLRGVCVLLSDVAACAMVLYLLPLFPDITFIWLPLAVWAVFLMVHFLICLRLTGRGISMNAYLVWNGAAGALGAFLVSRGTVCPEHMGMAAAMALVCAFFTAVHGAYAAWTLPGANVMIKYVDSLVVILAFYLYAAASSGWVPDRDIMLLAAAALLLDLAVINQLRTNDETVNIIRGAGAGSRLILFLIVLAIVALTGLVTGLASGQIHSAVDVFLWFMIQAAGVMNVVFSIIGTVIAWIVILIFSFFPAMPQAARENAQTMLRENVEEIVEETGLTLPLWFWQILGVLLLAAAITGILYTFRNVKLARVHRPANRQKAVKRSHVGDELRRLFKKSKEAVVFELCYWKYRRTPAGLLVYADRTGKRVKSSEKGSRENLGRKKGESPGEYMRRLAAHVPKGQEGQTEDAESLRRLAVLFDEIYYHGQDISLTRAECQKYEKILQTCSFQTSLEL